ncbi:extensin family protein [Phreatobacter stygius]|uniref:Extensin family protein n=1 Tax=Phreatobacter stygius TaxID=1940610 RepID=A0A4D7B3N3_9HYPH|nr:extensin family protein [Phreatobacter stygius]QCI65158.1 extensin family protein [Phreatobacter stygius]
MASGSGRFGLSLPVSLAIVLIVAGHASPAEAARRYRSRPVPARMVPPAPVPLPRPPEAPAVAAPGPAAAPAAAAAAETRSGEPAPVAPATAACLDRLRAIGVRFVAAPVPDTAANICSIATPVRLEALDLGAGQVLDLPDRPLVDCPFAETLALFARDLMAPLARSQFETQLARLGTGPGFECRPRNRVAGARISSHGQGRAIDIAWFGLADTKRIVVEHPADDTQKRFIDAVRRAACGWFTTVLGPGSNAAHANHLHFDREPRGRNGESRLCE